MEEIKEAVRDLKIRGTASASGGEFRRVYIQGEGEIEGDVRCTSLKVMGVLGIHGQLESKTVRIMGTSEIEGNCNVDEIKLTGDIVVKGDCSAELFLARGGFTIQGLLNAGKVDIKLYGPAFVSEIGGDDIQVKAPFRVFSGYKVLTADIIEGDEIHIEHTRAKVVRGNKVYIGDGCQIDLVEYKEGFRQTKKAVVSKAEKYN